MYDAGVAAAENHEMKNTALRGLFAAALLTMMPTMIFAEGIGRIKNVAGEVTIARKGQAIPAVLGAAVYAADRITTGSDGSVGLLLDDDSRLALGPKSSISLDKFDFDFATHEGECDVSMRRGVLSVVSGKMTQKTPGALRVQTPSAILAVRGTEFSVKVEGSDSAEQAR